VDVAALEATLAPRIHLVRTNRVERCETRSRGSPSHNPAVAGSNPAPTSKEGGAYITGYTFSSDFPTTVGTFDTTANGSYDGFVMNLALHVSSGSLCALTQQFVQNSPNYQALPTDSRAIADALGAALCQQLATMTPRI
jgi:hypothetical protein